MTESIFRFTNTGDTVGTIAATEIIEFNLSSSTKPDGTAKLVEPSFRIGRDINFHPTPRQIGDPLQDALAGVLDIEIAGFFVNRLNTLGPKNLTTWQIGSTSGAKTTDFPQGRFGMDISSFGGLLSLTPTPTLGYILYDIDVQDVEDPRDDVPFIARFYLNGTYTEFPGIQ